MNIDWFTFGAQLVNFVVLLYLLKRFLYAPITNAIQQREKFIAARMAEADGKQAAADRSIKDYQNRSEKLERERRDLFEQTKSDVETSRRQLMKQARSDVRGQREDWLASLHRERSSLSQMVRQRCSQQITAATRQAMRELADEDLEEQILRTFVEKLDQQGSAGFGHNRHDANGNPRATVHTAFDVSPIWRDRLKSALAHHFEFSNVEFCASPEIVCGIEVHVGDQKLGWSVKEFLATLEEEFSRLVERPTP